MRIFCNNTITHVNNASCIGTITVTIIILCTSITNAHNILLVCKRTSTQRNAIITIYICIVSDSSGISAACNCLATDSIGVITVYICIVTDSIGIRTSYMRSVSDSIGIIICYSCPVTDSIRIITTYKCTVADSIGKGIRIAIIICYSCIASDSITLITHCLCHVTDSIGIITACNCTATDSIGIITACNCSCSSRIGISTVCSPRNATAHQHGTCQNTQHNFFSQILFHIASPLNVFIRACSSTGLRTEKKTIIPIRLFHLYCTKKKKAFGQGKRAFLIITFHHCSKSVNIITKE